MAARQVKKALKMQTAEKAKICMDGKNHMD